MDNSQALEENKTTVDLTKETQETQNVNLTKEPLQNSQPAQENINQQQPEMQAYLQTDNYINQQQAYNNQQQYIPPQQSYNQQPPYINPQDKAKNTENILAYTALGCYIGSWVVPLISTVLSVLIAYTGSETFGMLVMSLGSLASLAGMAGLVMMIILRVQYPKNTIGKVLMWLYIVSLILTILAVLLLIAFCNAILYSCQGIY